MNYGPTKTLEQKNQQWYDISPCISSLQQFRSSMMQIVWLKRIPQKGQTKAIFCLSGLGFWHEKNSGNAT